MACQEHPDIHMDMPDEVRDASRALEEACEPLDAVVASRRLRAALDRWERQLVAEACAGGRSWDAVGRALGLSRQAAWEKYRRQGGTDGPRRLEVARERQRAQLAEARRLRAEARHIAGDERSELLRRADELRAEALAALEDVRKETT